MKHNTQTEVKDKRTLYKTAKAMISCAHFQAGDFVSVQYMGRGREGVHYYNCFKSHGDFAAAYPEHHLSDFVL